jgi:hypothetical protein
VFSKPPTFWKAMDLRVKPAVTQEVRAPSP